MIPHWMSRTQLVLGEDRLYQLISKHVLIAGLGGVGGICAEMLVRAGVGKITIIDADKVDITNCNRQIIALHSNEGKLKTEILADRLRDINPALQLHVLHLFLEEQNIPEVLQREPLDYVVDCIDTLRSKVALIKICKESDIPLISSMGAGGKFNPTLVKVTDIKDTYQCNLARYVRKRLHTKGIDSGVKVVFSAEPVDPAMITTINTYPKRSIVGTISYMPAVYGCTAASVVIRDLLDISVNNK